MKSQKLFNPYLSFSIHSLIIERMLSILVIGQLMQLLVALLLVVSALCLPYREQMTLVNSMMVGHNDDMDIVNWDCKMCLPSNRPNHAHYIEEKAKDIKCILAVYDDLALLIFRYTNTAQNVWQDILYADQVAVKEACDKCKAQKAYTGMWNLVKPNVFRDLKEIQQQTGILRLIIGGISLGGGLSLISFKQVRDSGIFKHVEVITYGSPRVLNKEYAKVFDDWTNGTSKRYIVNGDPIPAMPVCVTLICNYGNTGVPYICSEDKEICVKSKDENYSPAKVVGHYLTQHPNTGLGSLVDHIKGYSKIYDFTVYE